MPEAASRHAPREGASPEASARGAARPEGAASAPAARLLREGETCWRLRRASRVAFLVDAERYFAAVDAAFGRARRSILVAGWDVSSRVDLAPGAGPRRLAQRLDALVRARRGLHVHVLDWDYSLLYTLDREALPSYQLGSRTHRRVHFHLDSAHPLGACQHQKIVVVDDRVAFCGGIDLTERRWDTREHRPDDPRRRTADGTPYDPQHDVQALVDGPAAAALGDLVRERWRRATGRALRPATAPRGAPDPWPVHVEPDLRDVDVGIARTVAAWEGGEAAHEVERLFVESIAAARRTVYIENQYLTSACVTEALEARLAERDGPEVVILLPQRSGRWLEDSTMGVRRQQVLRRLHAADAHGRLLVRAPMTGAGAAATPIKVHAKVMIVDDRLARVGSANTSNRSMRLDTECDLAVEAVGERAADVAAAIARFRDDLVAEHLGVGQQRVRAAREREGSLIGAIESIAADVAGNGRARARSLAPIEDDDEWRWLHEILPAESFDDPTCPLDSEQIAARVLHDDRSGRPRLRQHGRVLLLLVALLALAAAWRWTPLGEWIDPERITGWIAAARGVVWLPLAAVAVCAVGAMILVPLALLVVACAMALGPVVGVASFYAGMLAGAAAAYGIGRRMSGDVLQRAARGRLARLDAVLENHGVLAVATLRLLPIAPFVVVNAVAGHIRVPFRDYMLGTLVGMAPGTLVVALAGTALESALTDAPLALAWGAAALLVLCGAGVWLLRARRREAGGGAAVAAGERPGG